MRNFKKILIALIVICSTPLFAEYIFLRNGSIITGKIVNETADYIVVNDGIKTEQKIPYENIIRTVFKEVYMGKQMIQLTSGRRFEAYLVHEDRKTYVFRNELYKPDEYSIERDKVLYMTRNNPTDLEAIPRSTSVELTWKPSYRPQKKYNVYMKGPKDNAYQKIGEVYNPEFTAKDLLGKTQYSFIVKGLEDKRETLPTNEVILKTTIPPERPTGLSETKKISGDKKEKSITLKWNPAADKDGRVVKYIIYERLDDELKKVGETPKTTFSIGMLDPKKDYKFYISAIDDDEAESELPKIITKKRFGIAITGFFAMPVTPGVTSMGYGFNVGLHLDYRFLYADMFFMSAIIGGTFTLHPNVPFDTFTDKKNAMAIGAWGGIGLGFLPAKWFGIELKLMGGYVGSILDNRTMNTQAYSNNAGANAVLEAQFYITSGLALTVDVGYMMIFYTPTIMHDLHFGGGIQFRF